MHENQETSVLAASSSPAQEGEKPKLGMHGTEESESAVVCAEQLIAHEG